MDRDPYAAPESGPPLAHEATLPPFSPLLLRAALATMGGLVLGSGLLVVAVVAWFGLTAPDERALLDQGARMIEVFLFALVFGGLPALMIGAPGYALLVRWGWVNAPSAAVLSAAPGLTLLAFDARAALPFLVFGIVVALATHALFQWGPRSRKDPG